MAQRRMFTLQIVDTDAFLDMSQGAQLLYFHLAMRADDDGFVDNPKKIMRTIGSSNDDYKILVAKRFILVFNSGIIVIKHWKMHNYIQSDRYHETKYLEEKAQLLTKENGSYTERIQNVYNMDTQVRLGKVRLELGKVSLEEAEPSSADTSTNDFLYKFKEINPSYKQLFKNKTQRAAMERLLQEHGAEKVQWLLEAIEKTSGSKYAPTITTPLQLETKLAELLVFLKKEGIKKPNIVKIS